MTQQFRRGHQGLSQCWRRKTKWQKMGKMRDEVVTCHNRLGGDTKAYHH